MSRAAILIDGGYFLKRLPSVRPDIDASSPIAVADSIHTLVHSHLNQINQIYGFHDHMQLLYRTFYYDALPHAGKAQTPIRNRPVDHAKSETALFRVKLFEELRRRPYVAVRLGNVRLSGNPSWTLKPTPQKRLIDGTLQAADLDDSHFVPAFRQKGVDMRIGIDIASITLKRHADVIVLVAGDSDFVPAIKFARREGVQLILDPLWQTIPDDLSEHIDALRSGFPRPLSRRASEGHGSANPHGA